MSGEIKIRAVEVRDDGNISIIPEIPFSEFPPGRRTAGPDPDKPSCYAYFVQGIGDND